MQSVFIELTKYIFAFLMAFYVLSAYRGAIIHKEEKRKGIYVQQYIIIFAIHFLGYYVLYIMKQDVKYIGFYFVQLIYLIIFIAFYYILYPKASRLLVNNMCMLMAVGFIMIARLNFDKCVKQFVIAVLGTVIMFMVPWLLKTVKSFRNFGWIYCITGLVLLCAVLLGSKVYGANLTLSIGAFSVQPAEFVKICMLCLLLRCLISQRHLNRHVLLQRLQHFMLLFLCFQLTLVLHLYSLWCILQCFI